MAVPIAAEIPAIESANPNGGDVGGVSGHPLMYANPLPVSATVPNPGFAGVRPVLPEPADAGHHQPRVVGRERVVAHPPRRHPPRPEALDDDVDLADEPAHVAVVLAAQVERHRPLAGVEPREPERLAVLHRRPLPRVVTGAGSSTLMTSAPKSRSIRPQVGAAYIVPSSRTRDPGERAAQRDRPSHSPLDVLDLEVLAHPPLPQLAPDAGPAVAPNGASGRIAPPPLIHTVPARICWAMRRASTGSLHQTFAASPYAVSFASRIASSVSLNGRITATGPKISCWTARRRPGGCRAVPG